jgi:hypothetical protein
MPHALRRHPQSSCEAASRVEVEVTLPTPQNLVLQYVVTGNMNDLRIPPAAACARADELWRHTCFEAFVGAPPGAYYEFNFAPSTQWAAYRFSGYRDGMTVADETPMPRLNVQQDEGRLVLQASLELGQLSGLQKNAARRLGLSAVIEEMNGRTSYWALAHPAGKADFHHPDGFAFEIPASVSS